MKIQLLTWACCALFYMHPSVAQSRLERSKSDVKSSSNSGKSNSSSSSSARSSGGGDGTIAEAVVQVFSIGFYYTCIGDYQHENHLYSRLTQHPFGENGLGNYEVADTVKQGKNRFRIDFDNKFLYSDSNLYGNHINLKIRPFQYFYVSTDYQALSEKNAFTNQKYHLSIFQFNFNYDRIRFHNFNLGWSMGATYLASDVQKSGFSGGLNAEYFFPKRFSIFATGKWSSVNHTPVNFLEMGARVHSKNYYFTLGFERMKIGTPVYNFMGIGGGIYF